MHAREMAYVHHEIDQCSTESGVGARRWQDGMCTFGDRCNYAHGEGELRALAPEGYDILEKREQRRARQEVWARPRLPACCPLRCTVCIVRPRPCPCRGACGWHAPIVTPKLALRMCSPVP